nr:FtsW/RodA/SpoVE family cell cycle protein [Moraxella sp. CTOTU48268]
MEKFPDNRAMLSSAWIYPLFVGFVTFGLMILFDLSTRSYLSLRYIFLNHFKDLFWCFVFISLARPISSLLSWGLKTMVANNLLHSSWGNIKSAMTKARVWLLAFAVGYLGLAVFIHSDSAKVAELSKIWLMVFLGVFLAINQRGLINHLFFRSKKMTLLLAFAVVLPFIALGIANEKGTMLVFLFLFTFLVGVALSNKIFQMGGRGYILGVLSSTAILLLLMMVLVNLSGFDARTAERVNAWVNPFVASNDQMAILHWFRDSVPMIGYGFGDIPWCGYHLSGCQGVPLQMQSDYTITSVMAVVGIGASVVLMMVYFAWLALIARQQMAFASEQMKSRLLSGGYFLLAWVILLWVVITVFQALVTISGNLGILPLTGVTLPFLSYGTSNLWLNSIMLSLALFQPKLMLDGNKPYAQ